jgi:hypothetical protein
LTGARHAQVQTKSYAILERDMGNEVG